MLKIELTERIPNFAALPRRMQVELREKVEELTRRLFFKVIENVSGGILQTKTGQLKSSINQEVEVTGNLIRGRVFVQPAPTKAWVLEKGGKGEYFIVPVKAKYLHFFDKSGEEVFTKKVKHPPSKAFRYLGTALEEFKPQAKQEFAAWLADLLSRGQDWGAGGEA